MTACPGTVLVVGATGSIGHLVVEEAIRQGYITRALVRDPAKATTLPPDTDIVVGDVTRPETLQAAVAGADAIVFTHGLQRARRAPDRPPAGRHTPGRRLQRRRHRPEPDRRGPRHSLASPPAVGKTFELVAAAGSAPDDFDALYAPLEQDAKGNLDGVEDQENMPLADEPQRVREDLENVVRH